MRRERTNPELLPKERKCFSPHQTPHLIRPAPEREAPTTSAFETNESCIHETQRLSWTEKLLLQGLCSDSFIPGLSTKANIWKAPRIYVEEIILLNLKHQPEEQGPIRILARDEGAGRHYRCPLPCYSITFFFLAGAIFTFQIMSTIFTLSLCLVMLASVIWSADSSYFWCHCPCSCSPVDTHWLPGSGALTGAHRVALRKCRLVDTTLWSPSAFLQLESISQKGVSTLVWFPNFCSCCQGIPLNRQAPVALMLTGPIGL